MRQTLNKSFIQCHFDIQLDVDGRWPVEGNIFHRPNCGEDAVPGYQGAGAETTYPEEYLVQRGSFRPARITVYHPAQYPVFKAGNLQAIGTTSTG